jgi:hypothetical protein
MIRGQRIGQPILAWQTFNGRAQHGPIAQRQLQICGAQHGKTQPALVGETQLKCPATRERLGPSQRERLRKRTCGKSLVAPTKKYSVGPLDSIQVPPLFVEV